MIKTIQEVINRNLEGLKEEISYERNHFGLNAEDYARLLGYNEELEVISSIERAKIHFEDKFLSEEEFEQKFQIQYLPTLRFSSTTFLHKTLKNFPYLFRFFEKQYLEKPATAPITIKWINNSIGYGLFASADIKKGAVIGEYTGFIRRYYRRAPKTNGYCFKYPTRFWSLSYTLIDAKEGGNETRFINHSNTHNLAPDLLFHGNLIRTVFIANRFIKEGEELTFNYGDDYWRKRLQIS